MFVPHLKDFPFYLDFPYLPFSLSPVSFSFSMTPVCCKILEKGLLSALWVSDLLKRALFHSLYVYATFSGASWLQMLEFMSWVGIYSTDLCLFLCKCHGFLTNAFKQFLKRGCIMIFALFSLLKVALVVWNMLWFATSVKTIADVLMETTLG